MSNKSDADALCPDGRSPLVSAIMNSRKMPDDFDITDCDLSNLHNPSLLGDIENGAARLVRAIETGERVAVYGDYDVDGITSTCLMASYLSDSGLEPEVYIPERLVDGYGLCKDSIDQLKALDVTLIITVDCGISAIEEVAYAKSLGIEMIITDHHECKGKSPDAVAVIDPKKVGDPYPFKSLAGVGVAFKLICSVHGEGSEKSLFEKYGDLVTLGTVADMMPLTDENRVMVRNGISLINKSPRPGLAALMKEAGINPGEMTSQTISFVLAPRLNAAGRMGSALLALELLSQDDPDRARFLAAELGSLNKLRQKTESRILAQAISLLEEEGYSSGPIVLAQENWHQGVVGIVAARLMRIYSEPVALISLEDGVGKGSCRSPEGFNIFEALDHCGDFLSGFGGHQLAAGLTVDEDKINNFKAKLSRYYDENPPDMDKNALTIDFLLSEPSLISMENIKSLDILEPFGTGNPAPVICIDSAVLKGVVPLSGGKHIRLLASKWGVEFDCVFFSASPDNLEVSVGDSFDIAFTPQINSFRGIDSAQLLVSDIRPAMKTSGMCVQVPGGLNEDMRGICPDRTDFAHLYKYISGKKGGRLSGQKSHLLSEMETGTGRGSGTIYYLCLTVMDELGLLTLTEYGDEVDVTLSPNPIKVDLESSALLQSLRRESGINRES